MRKVILVVLAMLLAAPALAGKGNHGPKGEPIGGRMNGGHGHGGD